jgi:hypothetical protein
MVIFTKLKTEIFEFGRRIGESIFNTQIKLYTNKKKQVITNIRVKNWIKLRGTLFLCLLTNNIQGLLFY